jgi:trans-2,3-dihydro-3-hydroxyanthranilate isomerase
VQLDFRLVDVFAERPLAGNQLCVVLDVPESLDPGLMQAVAKEIGFSETTFVTAAKGDRYRMRIFTPGRELPFAGHPTLGTAFVLVSEGRVTSPAVQEVAAGEIPVEADARRGFARMRQLPPEFDEEFPDRERAAAAAGLGPEDLHPELPPQVVSTGLRQLIVPVRDADAVARAAMDPPTLGAVVEHAGADGFYLFAPTEEGAKARFFGPGVGVDEDAATGSAAGPLGAYLAARGFSGPIVVRQGEEIGRPSVLHVDVTGTGGDWQVTVGGGVFTVGGGELDLPD